MLPSFPFYPLKSRTSERGAEVWDDSRKKWLMLTPEEMVRQQLIAHLIQHCGVPPTLIATEKAVRVGERMRRFDIGIWTTSGSIWLLAECKSPNLALGEFVLDQVLSYASQLPCQFLLISNGHSNLMWHLGKGGQQILEWPKWK